MVVLLLETRYLYTTGVSVTPGYIPGYILLLHKIIGPFTHPHSTSQVLTTQLAKMSIDPKFVELTAGVLEIYILNTLEIKKQQHRQTR